MMKAVDAAMQDMNKAAAKLGSIVSRINTQTDFVSKLTDSINSGIGKLVDADMEAESSKLTALQTQQQLAFQSLSIANSSSQSILSLFRG
jgi:flagellin